MKFLFGGMKGNTLVVLYNDNKRDIVLLCSAITPTSIITQPEDPMNLEGASTELSKLLDEVGRVFLCHPSLTLLNDVLAS